MICPPLPPLCLTKVLRLLWTIKPRIALIAILVLGSLPFLAPYVLDETSSAESDNNQPARLARLSETVSVRVSGRGSPTISLNDGREVLAGYDGPEQLRRVLEQNQAQPLSLTAADFDEDGVPDLISGYGYAGRGILSLMRGNVDSIYPNSPDAQQRRTTGTFTNAPFLSPARVFDAPIKVDFVGAGDFDGDNHWDVVVASRNASSLYLFPGDGSGEFSSPKEISLPGMVTAFLAGDLNRRDGLTDIAIGINGPNGPAVLIFEGPEGALRGVPEIIPMDRPVVSLALGQLDNSAEMDLAIAAGNELLIVKGRDRKLSLNQQQQASVPRVELTTRVFPEAILSTITGDFSADGQIDAAVLLADGSVDLLIHPNPELYAEPTNTDLNVNSWKSSKLENQWPEAVTLVRGRISSGGADDLFVVDARNRQLNCLSFANNSSVTADNVHLPHITQTSLDVYTGSPTSVLPMRLNEDALTDLVVLSDDKSAATVVLSGLDSSHMELASSAVLPAVTVGPWTSTGSLSISHTRHTATVLDNGKVFIAGGSNGNGLVAVTELYDPSTETWSTLASMPTRREYLTATRLFNGKVLLVGGANNTARLATVELYDPTVNSWSSAGSLAAGRSNHTATLLPNGKVLIAGGYDNNLTPTTKTELYDPSTNTWSAAGNLAMGRADSVAILLQNGKVLISGGYNSGPLASSEVYDPSTNTWSSVGNLNVARSQHTGVLLSSGKVLVVGGNGATSNLASAERYDPVTNSWTTVAGLTTGRQAHSMTLLGNGNVLVAGGFGGASLNYLGSSETYDPLTNNWNNGGNMATARGIHAAVLLQNGKVLVSGGYNGNFMTTAELYDPAVPGPTPTPTPTPTPIPNTNPAIFIVNSAADTDDGVCNLSNCTLREAIKAANANLGADTITFKIATGPQTITPLSALPTIIEAITIDATTQPGFVGKPIIELNGTSAGPSVNGLTIQASNCVVRGLVVNTFQANGIQIAETSTTPFSNNLIEGNYIGTDITGTIAKRNTQNAITLIGVSLSTIGGTTTAARNIISGTILITLGRTNPAGDVIQGNYIGTDVTGLVALGGLVNIAAGKDHIIGGTTPPARNVIGSVILSSPSAFDTMSGILVQGNYIGTDATGTKSLGGGGVRITQPSFAFIVNNTIGGTVVGARNLISGNVGDAIFLDQEEVRGTLVQGNFIGTDVTGTVRLGNAGSGVSLQFATQGNVIGGAVVGARNIISGNTGSGIRRAQNTPVSAAVNTIDGNFIGTDATGTKALGNDGDGVSATIALNGGGLLIRNNVISGNKKNGISIGIPISSFTTNETSCVMQGNFIGTDFTGTAHLGNTLDGITFNPGAFSNTVIENTIAFNGSNGVNVPGIDAFAAARNIIQSNSIYSNTALGINLGNPGVTPNDFQDPDVGGNTLQNFPVLTSFGASSKTGTEESDLKAHATKEATVSVNGTLNSTPNTTFTIHWYFTADAQCTNNQLASRVLATGKVPGVTTDSAGNASFGFPFAFPANISSGVINTTATDPNGNTSEFSACFPVTAPRVQITVQTSPAARTISIDGAAPVTAPAVVSWIVGSSHIVSTTSPQMGTAGTQYVWTSWNDNLPISHNVTAPNSDTIYIANFTTQYMLTMSVGTGGTATPSSAFVNSGQAVQINATPNSGFIFNGWTGTGPGSFSGSSNPASVLMSGPITQTANFMSATALRLMIENPGSVADLVLALDSTSLLRDPFPVVKLSDWLAGTDKNTRLIIFLQNFQAVAGEPPSAVVVNLVGSNNEVFDVAAEDVRPLLSTNLTQVTFRLPNNLSVGTCVIKVKAHDQTTNSGALRVKL